jgi:hypothetical protein
MDQDLFIAMLSQSAKAVKTTRKECTGGVFHLGGTGQASWPVLSFDGERRFRTNSMDKLKIFCSYAPKDKNLMESFSKHLRTLESQQVSIWYARDMLPGADWEQERDRQLHSAHLILLLVSPEFISSPEQRQKEVLPTMERYRRGEARVIPIILRPVHWQEAPFGKLLPLPEDGKPVNHRSWKSQDEAFLNVVNGLSSVIQEIRACRSNAESLSSVEEVVSEVKPSLVSPEPVDTTNSDASTQLEQIIENFRLLRRQITSFVSLNRSKEVTIARCENQYNKLYADTMIFLTTYLPEHASDDSEGFAKIVYRKAIEDLHGRGDVFVEITRFLVSPLARLEKLAAHTDACIATLELYKQKYLTA